MKTFYISVTETLNKIVEVQANDEFELDYNDHVDVNFDDDTEALLESYNKGEMPKFYEVK